MTLFSHLWQSSWMAFIWKMCYMFRNLKQTNLFCWITIYYYSVPRNATYKAFIFSFSILKGFSYSLFEGYTRNMFFPTPTANLLWIAKLSLKNLLLSRSLSIFLMRSLRWLRPGLSRLWWDNVLVVLFKLGLFILFFKRFRFPIVWMDVCVRNEKALC